MVPGERPRMGVELTDKGFLILRPKPLEYHLEDVGFVSVPPRIWGTWASFSIPFSFYETLSEFLDEFRSDEKSGLYLASRGSGRRIEVYAYRGRTRKDLGIPVFGYALGIPVFGYALGLHGLTLAEEYLREKAEESGVPEGRLRYLKLGLRKRKETKAGLKVGVAWENGKPSEITLKLSTTDPKVRIQGLYGELMGKSRGELTRTDDWYIVVHTEDFAGALHEVAGTFG